MPQTGRLLLAFYIPKPPKNSAALLTDHSLRPSAFTLRSSTFEFAIEIRTSDGKGSELRINFKDVYHTYNIGYNNRMLEFI